LTFHHVTPFPINFLEIHLYIKHSIYWLIITFIDIE